MAKTAEGGWEPSQPTAAAELSATQPLQCSPTPAYHPPERGEKAYAPSKSPYDSYLEYQRRTCVAAHLGVPRYLLGARTLQQSRYQRGLRPAAAASSQPRANLLAPTLLDASPSNATEDGPFQPRDEQHNQESAPQPSTDAARLPAMSGSDGCGREGVSSDSAVGGAGLMGQLNWWESTAPMALVSNAGAWYDLQLSAYAQVAEAGPRAHDKDGDSKGAGRERAPSQGTRRRKKGKDVRGRRTREAEKEMVLRKALELGPGLASAATDEDKMEWVLGRMDALGGLEVVTELAAEIAAAGTGGDGGGGSRRSIRQPDSILFAKIKEPGPVGLVSRAVLMVRCLMTAYRFYYGREHESAAEYALGFRTKAAALAGALLSYHGLPPMPYMELVVLADVLREMQDGVLRAADLNRPVLPVRAASFSLGAACALVRAARQRAEEGGPRHGPLVLDLQAMMPAGVNEAGSLESGHDGRAAAPRAPDGSSGCCAGTAAADAAVGVASAAASPPSTGEQGGDQESEQREERARDESIADAVAAFTPIRAAAAAEPSAACINASGSNPPAIAGAAAASSCGTGIAAASTVLEVLAAHGLHPRLVTPNQCPHAFWVATASELTCWHVTVALQAAQTSRDPDMTYREAYRITATTCADLYERIASDEEPHHSGEAAPQQQQRRKEHKQRQGGRAKAQTTDADAAADSVLTGAAAGAAASRDGAAALGAAMLRRLASEQPCDRVGAPAASAAAGASAGGSTCLLLKSERSFAAAALGAETGGAAEGYGDPWDQRTELARLLLAACLEGQRVRLKTQGAAALQLAAAATAAANKLLRSRHGVLHGPQDQLSSRFGPPMLAMQLLPQTAAHALMASLLPLDSRLAKRFRRTALSPPVGSRVFVGGAHCEPPLPPLQQALRQHGCAVVECLGRGELQAAAQAVAQAHLAALREGRQLFVLPRLADGVQRKVASRAARRLEELVAGGAAAADKDNTRASGLDAPLSNTALLFVKDDEEGRKHAAGGDGSSSSSSSSSGVGGGEGSSSDSSSGCGDSGDETDTNRDSCHNTTGVGSGDVAGSSTAGNGSSSQGTGKTSRLRKARKQVRGRVPLHAAAFAWQFAWRPGFNLELSQLLALMDEQEGVLARGWPLLEGACDSGGEGGGTGSWAAAEDAIAAAKMEEAQGRCAGCGALCLTPSTWLTLVVLQQ